MEHLKPDDIVDHLISKGLIGDSAQQRLCLPINTLKDKNRIIITELRSGGPDTFGNFCEILKKSSLTKHIADHLEKSTYTCVSTIKYN